MPIKILADSLNIEEGTRVTTFLLSRFPKLLQAELRTHRSLSQSHYSSRAIPIKRVIRQVEEDPFIFKFTRYKKGMGGVDDLTEQEKEEAIALSLHLRDKAISTASWLSSIGVAKQEANRYLEPWMHGSCVVTGDDIAWDSFFSLRCPADVQPDFREFALPMWEARKASQPIHKRPGDWHIPWGGSNKKIETAVARCARCSFENHNGKQEWKKDKELTERLIRDKHMTPFEHCLVAGSGKFRNFHNWKPYRQVIEEEI